MACRLLRLRWWLCVVLLALVSALPAFAPTDLAQWVRKLFRGEAGVTADLIQEMTDVEQFGNGYGLGCNHNSKLGFGHVGALPGYMTVANYDPEKDTAVVVFANIINADDLEGQVFMMYEAGRLASELVSPAK